MKLTPESLQHQWDSINYKNGGFLQINIQHPLEWHIGYQSISQKTLLLVCNIEIDTVESSQSMAVNRRRRETDNRWTLTLELLRDEQQSVFAILCCDIIEHSRSATNETEALALVISRYKQWSRLLESQKSGLMSEPTRKGLLGELLFLEQRIATSDSFLATIQGWVGAEGSDQDFIYRDGWYEIKSIGVSASTITISSLEQLDREDAGELVIMRIDKCAPDMVGALSLNDVVYRITRMIASSIDALDAFRSKLSSYGYIDLQEYSVHKYNYSSMQQYTVDESFPRMTSRAVPIEIVSVQYELALPALAGWLKG